MFLDDLGMMGACVLKEKTIVKCFNPVVARYPWVGRKARVDGIFLMSCLVTVLLIVGDVIAFGASLEWYGTFLDIPPA